MSLTSRNSAKALSSDSSKAASIPGSIDLLPRSALPQLNTSPADQTINSRHRASPRKGHEPGQVALLAALPAAWLAFTVWYTTVGRDWHVRDFLTFRTAANAVMHGQAPYPAADAKLLATGYEFVYPPVAAYLFAPFTLLSAHAAAIVYLAVSIAAVAGAMWLLDVRDWRCYGAVALWQPLFTCLIVGAVGPLLVLLAAVAWRWRHRTAVVAGAVAAAVAVKLFLWPLLVWLFLRRRTAALVAAAVTVVAVLVPFAEFDEATLRGYPTLLSRLETVFGPQGYSITALLDAVGLPAAGTRAAVMVLAVGAVGVIAWLGSHGADRDRRSFVAATVAALLLSPIVWSHYFLLLIVPIAVARNRFGLVWLLPLAMWAVPSASLGSVWRLAVVLGMVAVVAAASLRASRLSGGRGLAPVVGSLR